MRDASLVRGTRAKRPVWIVEADEATLDQLEANNQIVFRYADDEGNITPEANPNGSARNIAGIINERGNVLGIMPHPERCVEPLLGSADGRLIFESLGNVLVG